MGTKNNPGKYDCYEKAEPDEPISVLFRTLVVVLASWVAAGSLGYMFGYKSCTGNSEIAVFEGNQAGD